MTGESVGLVAAEGVGRRRSDGDGWLLRDLTRDTNKSVRPMVGLGPGQTAEPANCCQPLPGERIVGITYRGKGVQVHSIDCAALTEFEEQPDRWIGRDTRYSVP